MDGSNLHRKSRICPLGILSVMAFLGSAVCGQEPSSLGFNDLVRMTPAQLEALYAGAQPGTIPSGKVRGRALLRPGTKIGPAMSQGAGVAWQGKVFAADGTSSINRFFGVKMIRAEVSYGPSWRDGNPAIILDYSQTSRVYANYRDELREVAPGLWLGLMFDRSSPPALKMYFAIQAVSHKP